MATPAEALPTHRDDLSAVSALAEPSRRALYEYVCSQRVWVSRDQAANAVGLRRGIAAHHLDRLAEDGLLDTEFKRLTGRTGPGAGRPAKVYRRAAAEIDVSLPPRHYDLAGKVLSAAAVRSSRDGTEISAAIGDEAERVGRRIATEGVAKAEVGPCATNRRDVLFDELRSWGYEPQTREDGVTVLHNCPFHQLSTEHTELICGMNLRLLEGAVDALDGVGLRAALEPSEGDCCVRFHPESHG